MSKFKLSEEFGSIAFVSVLMTGAVIFPIWMLTQFTVMDICASIKGYQGKSNTWGNYECQPIEKPAKNSIADILSE